MAKKPTDQSSGSTAPPSTDKTLAGEKKGDVNIDVPAGRMVFEGLTPEVEAEAASTPIGATHPRGSDLGPAEMKANAAARRRAAAGTAIVEGSGLVADPDYRISLSDPRVERQHTESQAKLEALLEKLNAVHGEDVGEPNVPLNTEQVPLTEDELNLLRSTVSAQSVDGLALSERSSLISLRENPKSWARRMNRV